MRWIWDWAKYHDSHSSESIRVIKLFFCQNGVLIGRSIWPKDSLVTLILFELWLLWYLAQSQIHRNLSKWTAKQVLVFPQQFPSGINNFGSPCGQPLNNAYSLFLICPVCQNVCWPQYPINFHWAHLSIVV